jgi:hypothetical protein
MLQRQTRYNIASRFFEEMPDSLMKAHSTRDRDLQHPQSPMYSAGAVSGSRIYCS